MKNIWKILEKYWDILENIEKYWDILENIRKILKNIEKYWNILENIQKYSKIFKKNIQKNIFQKIYRTITQFSKLKLKTTQNFSKLYPLFFYHLRYILLYYYLNFGTKVLLFFFDIFL